MFWARISKLLTLWYDSAVVNGNLSSSQTKAVITLIHKGKDLARDNLKNWRPISLTDSDYKLLAKCFVLLLGDVINDDLTYLTLAHILDHAVCCASAASSGRSLRLTASQLRTK